MNEAREVGPRIDGYDKDIKAIAEALEAGTVVHTAFVAASTRWGMMFVPKNATRNYGQAPNGIGPYGAKVTEDEWTILEDNSYTHIVILQGVHRGAASLKVGRWHEPAFVNNRLCEGKLSDTDALALAGLLNRIERERVRIQQGDLGVVMDKQGDMEDDLPEDLQNLELMEWREFELMPYSDEFRKSEDGMALFMDITGTDWEQIAKFVRGAASSQMA